MVKLKVVLQIPAIWVGELPTQTNDPLAHTLATDNSPNPNFSVESEWLKLEPYELPLFSMRFIRFDSSWVILYYCSSFDDCVGSQSVGFHSFIEFITLQYLDSGGNVLMIFLCCLSSGSMVASFWAKAEIDHIRWSICFKKRFAAFAKTKNCKVKFDKIWWVD